MGPMNNPLPPKEIPPVVPDPHYQLTGKRLMRMGRTEPPVIGPTMRDFFGNPRQYYTLDHNKVTVTPMTPGGGQIDPTMIPKP